MKKRNIFLTTLLCTLCTVFSLSAANRFWITTASTDWNNTANWSTTSGGTGGASVPGSSDIAKFDGNGTGNCTINATVNVAGIDIGSGYSGTISQGGYVVTVGTSHFNVAGGTFTGGSVKIDINGGNFTLSGGTFTSTTDTLFIGGSICGTITQFNHSGGTFSHNNGAVAFDATGCWPTTQIINVITGSLFYNLIINSNGLPVNTAAADTVKADNNFAHLAGNLGGNCWSVKGNLSVGINASGGLAKLILWGTTSQTYSYSSGRTASVELNKSSGTVSAASGTTSLAVQGFKIISGTFTAPSGDFSIGGNLCGTYTVFTQSGGTFTHNNGRVVIDPTGCWPSAYSFDVNTSTAFYDMKINPGGFNYSIASGDTVKVENNLELTSGALSSGYLSLKGNLTIGNSSIGGTGQVIFTGTNNQTYAYTTGRLSVVTVNKTSGTVTAASGTTALNAQGFKLVQGSFTAPSGDFSIGGNLCGTYVLFTHIAGTYSHNNGRVVIDPTGCWPSAYSFDVNTSTAFYDMKINPGGFNYSIASGDTVKVENNLELTSGALSSGYLSLKGNLTIGNSSIGGTGQVIFTGTNNQTYAYGSGGRACWIVVNKTSGTVSAASGTTNLAMYGFRLYAGTFTAPTGNLDLSGNTAYDASIKLLHSGGTFNHNSGTLLLNYSCQNAASPIDVITSTLFNNIKINNPSGYPINAAAGDTVKAEGNFEHAGGTITSGYWQFKGNLTVGTAASAGGAEIIFTGTANQTYTYGSSGRTCWIAVNKTSGTVTAASGTTNLAMYGFRLYAGTFTAPPGNLDLSGNTAYDASIKLLHSGGTFNHNSGTLLLNYSCQNAASPIDVITSTLFNNIKINNPSGYPINAAAGDTVKAEGNFEHAGGTITSGYWQFKGNLTVGTAASAGGAEIIFTGTANQTYTYGSSGRTCWIAVNKTSGTVTAASGTTNLAMYGFRLYAGTFTAPPGNLDLSGNTAYDASIKLLHSGGTFNHNSGTLLLNYSCQNAASPIDVITSTLFNNIKINNPSGYPINAAAGDTVKAEGNFEHAGGTITSGYWQFKGNLTVGSAASAGGAEIIFTGTANQTYTYGSAGRTCKIKINKSSGSVSAASGTTNFAVQIFTLTSGTFNAPTGNLFVGGSLSTSTIFTRSGGTFNANTGTTVFDPYTGTFTVNASGVNFYKVTAKASSNLVLPSSTDTLKVDNILKLEQGAFNTGVLAAKGKVIVNTAWTGGTAQLLFCGSSDQDFELTSATDKFNGNVKIKKTSGKITLLSTCTLDQSGQTLTFVKGNIVSTPTFPLVIGNGVTVSGASDSSYVDGTVIKTGNSAFTFPIGANNKYRHLAISAPANTTDSYAARYMMVNSNNIYAHSSKDASINKLSRNELWILNRLVGSTNVNVTLSWDSATSCTIDNIANTKVCVWDGTTWKDKGNGGTTGNVYKGTVISSSAVSTFGTYTLGTSGAFSCESYSYTWNGSTSSVWNTITNWTPMGYPQAEDNATIVTGTNQPQYNGVEGLNNITMTSGTLNLDGYTLPITGTASFNGGTINNGTINATGSSTTFAGTTFGAAVTVNSADVYNTGSNVFNNKVKITKTSNTANTWTGGNTFNDSLIITNTGTNYIRLADTGSGDTYASHVVFHNTSSGAIYPAYAGTNTFSGNITLKGSVIFELGKGGGSIILNDEDQYIRNVNGSVVHSFKIDKPGDYTTMFRRLNSSNDFTGKMW
ncbi:MAG: hypothetical protein POELPBGB_03609 [Bacteroidia bacterium]|nr:hypothetical protein [Bacteroidia bacterium]